MKNKFIFFLLILSFSILLLSGCGAPDTGEAITSLPASGDRVAAARTESIGNRMQAASLLMGDTLYYEVLEKEDGSGLIQSSLYREDPAGSDAQLLACLENTEILWYRPDARGDVYLLCRTGGESPQHILRRLNAGGEPAYEQAFTGEEGDSLGTVAHGAVSSGGEVCLASSAGDVFFFSPQGELLAECRADWDKETYHGNLCGLVNAGEEGVYAYRISGGEASFRKADFSQHSLGHAVTVSLAAGEPPCPAGSPMGGSRSSIELFDGYGMGILISDGTGLRQYRPSDKTMRQLFLWGDSSVNLHGYMIDAVGILPEEHFYLLARRSYEDVAYVRVGYENARELTEKQTVTLGGISVLEIQWEQAAEMAGSFNRQSEDYRVELKPYDSIEDFYMDLIRGEGPDLIHMYNLDAPVLADKGILEDLSPYFAASSTAREDDILPSLIRAGTIGGKLVVIIPQYQVCGLMVEKGTVEGEGWTPDDFLSLAEENPDSKVYNQSDSIYRYMILNTIITADLDSYINWQEGCHFNTPEFIKILERIRQLPIPTIEDFDILSGDYNDYQEADWKQFTDKEYLIKEKYMNGLSQGMDEISFNGGITNGTFAQMTGYPNAEAKPYFELWTSHPIGINSASEAKEGAWAFVEYLLSAEYQNDERRTAFPARVDSFDYYMAKERLFLSDINVSKEDRDFLRWMVDHAYWSGNVSCQDIREIINEETESVWAGELSPEAAAQNIQNRVSLYLAE